ncbi:MAG: diguanylate cyclase [Cyanobacteria bacterium SZAS LIN-3]|nr:diguanylate cyclase [Cyanobacteria bacterium SZAS LIN-3]
MFKKSGSLLRSVPDIPTLHQLLAKCFQQPGEKLQVYWRNTENQLFILDVVYSLKERRPNWQLISEKSGRRTIIADYAGHDILLVYKQINSALSSAQDERAGLMGDESSRVSRTRDARAAAANWLESKKEADYDEPIQAPKGGSPDFWQDGAPNTWEMGGAIRKEYDEFDNYNGQAPAVSAALDESPWKSGPSAPAKNAIQQQPAKPQLRPGRQPQPQQAQPQQPLPKLPDAPAAPQAPPAPVKVTSAGPQANAPKTVSAQGPSLKPQMPPGQVARDRAAIHPDKGASDIDKRSSSQDRPERMDKQDKKSADRAPEKVAKEKKPPPEILNSREKQAAAERASQAAQDRKNIAVEKAAPKRISENPDLGKMALPIAGDLGDMTVAKLLKQFHNARITGRLEFVDGPINAFVFLDDGKVVEGWLGELKGDEALLELLLWTQGSYDLSIGMLATNRNVKSTPEELVQHNKNIASLLQELAGEGLNATSTFLPSNPQASSEEFEAMAKPDAPMELEKLAKLYVKLDGKKTIADLSELHVLPRTALVQAIHHLFYNGVIDIIDPSRARKQKFVTPKAIDGNAIQSVMMSLRRVDTGLFIFPAFLYFLEEEFFRIYRAKGSLTVILFEMREITAADGLVRRVSLSNDAIADATMRISKCKRHTDLIAHYEMNDFAILLPNTASGGARVFANKIIKALTESPLMGTQGKQLSFSFGSASMPEDFKDLPTLLGAAEMAMTFARQRGKPLVMFKDMEL